MKELPENTNLPGEHARLFATVMEKYGYRLDFSLHSLLNDVDSIFDDPRLTNIRNTLNSEPTTTGLTCDLETALACYLGETLKIEYKGEWKGHCATQSGANYYTSYMMFGDYKFHPYTYIGYRFANGTRDTGTMAIYLNKLIPSLEAGTDLKKQVADNIIKQGRVFHDTDPWI